MAGNKSLILRCPVSSTRYACAGAPRTGYAYERGGLHPVSSSPVLHVIFESASLTEPQVNLKDRSTPLVPWYPPWVFLLSPPQPSPTRWRLPCWSWAQAACCCSAPGLGGAWCGVSTGLVGAIAPCGVCRRPSPAPACSAVMPRMKQERSRSSSQSHRPVHGCPWSPRAGLREVEVLWPLVLRPRARLECDRAQGHARGRGGGTGTGHTRVQRGGWE